MIDFETLARLETQTLLVQSWADSGEGDWYLQQEQARRLRIASAKAAPLLQELMALFPQSTRSGNVWSWGEYRIGINLEPDGKYLIRCVKSEPYMSNVGRADIVTVEDVPTLAELLPQLPEDFQDLVSKIPV